MKRLLAAILTATLFAVGVEGMEPVVRTDGVEYQILGDGRASCQLVDAPAMLMRQTVENNGKKIIVTVITKGSRRASCVVIPNGVEIIGEKCFMDCKSLNEVIFEDNSSLRQIDKMAFSYSGLESIRIPATVEFIGMGCFRYCKSLREVIFEGDSNLREIDERAFSESGLESIRIPATVEIIGEHCFGYCRSLNEVIFEANSHLEIIDASAFRETNLRSIQIPSGVEIIGESCFVNAKI
ncbi:MAG: leucine-rich repeat domain-containing protein [Holosporaceae bacterium]|jgi:hypothetical protein|nr:leucine-rich repeat domain-containing protein [Holosporaceae bacterium]